MSNSSTNQAETKKNRIVVGTSKVSSKEPQLINKGNNKKVINRLMSSVRAKQNRPDMPPIAFFFIDSDGALQATGHKKLVSVLRKYQTELIKSVVEPPKIKDKKKPPKERFNMAKIPPTMDLSSLTYDDKRKYVSLIGNPPEENGVRRRNRWGFDEFKPSYWPADVNFVNPSSSMIDHSESQSFSRVLHEDDLNKIITAHLNAAERAEKEGKEIYNSSQQSPQQPPQHSPPEQSPQSSPPHSYVEQSPQPPSSPVQSPELQSSHSPQPEPPQTPGESESDSDDLSLDRRTKQNIKKGRFTQLRTKLSKISGLDCMVDLIDSILSSYAEWNGDPPTLDLQRLNARSVPGIANGKFILNSFADFWSSCSMNPTKLQVMSFAYFITHAAHYLKEYERSGTTLDQIMGCHNMTGVFKNTEEAVFTAALSIFSEKTEMASLMGAAGVLKSVIILHTRHTNEVHIVPPCTCEVASSQKELVRDGQTFAALVDREFVEGFKNLRPKNRASTISAPVIIKVTDLQVPGISSKVMYNYNGILIYQKDLATLSEGQWLSDAVVDAVISHFADVTPDVIALSTLFIQKLLISGSLLARPLRFRAYRKEEARSYWKVKGIGKRHWLLFPICNQVHWYLAAYSVAGNIIHVLCSLGGTYKEVEGLKRFLEEEMPVAGIKINYPVVPRQTNSNDCGVYVISYALHIAANLSVPDESMDLLTRKDIGEYLSQNFLL